MLLSLLPIVEIMLVLVRGHILKSLILIAHLGLLPSGRLHDHGRNVLNISGSVDMLIRLMRCSIYFVVRAYDHGFYHEESAKHQW